VGRIGAIALAAMCSVWVVGCNDDTVLRILVEPGDGPAPSSVRVTLTGVDAAPRAIAPVTLPGTVVVHHLPSSLDTLCVQVDGLDDAGVVVTGGAATVRLVAHGTTQATVSLHDPPAACAPPPDDLGGTTSLDLAGAPTDLGAADLAIAICPANAIFCDDFESGTLAKWTSASVKQDAGSLAVQSALKAHGSYALKALANGASGADVYAEAERGFPPTAPPFALRANVYFPTPLGHFNQLIALYENPSGSTNSFAIGGDTNSSIWEVSENQSLAGDRLSDMVPTGAGQWHCVELVIDSAGMVDFYVDGHHLIGPWARASAVTYSTLLVGVTRGVDPDYTAYIDDVAIGPTRLYCPP
jgi:hypothetical protein